MRLHGAMQVALQAKATARRRQMPLPARESKCTSRRKRSFFLRGTVARREWQPTFYLQQSPVDPGAGGQVALSASFFSSGGLLSGETGVQRASGNITGGHSFRNS